MNLQQFAFANSFSERIVPFCEKRICESIHRSECTQMELLSSLPVRKKLEIFGCFRAVSSGSQVTGTFSIKPDTLRCTNKKSFADKNCNNRNSYRFSAHSPSNLPSRSFRFVFGFQALMSHTKERTHQPGVNQSELSIGFLLFSAAKRVIGNICGEVF